MAGIGLYGVYYSKATMSGGVVTGYDGAKTMGKAISATFTPNESGSDPLRANNSISETDASTTSGGTLQLTLDRLKADAIEDLFGVELQSVSVTVGEQQVSGSGFDYTGNEQANAVGVAFIRQRQEDNSRAYHEAVIYSSVTFSTPTEDFQTMGESIEWQTPEIEGTVANNTGSYPWVKKYTFPTQAAAIAFIEEYFAAPTPPNAET